MSGEERFLLRSTRKVECRNLKRDNLKTLLLARMEARPITTPFLVSDTCDNTHVLKLNVYKISAF